MPFLLLMAYFEILNLLTNGHFKEANNRITQHKNKPFLYAVVKSLYYEFAQRLSLALKFAEKAWEIHALTPLESLMALSRLVSCQFRMGKFQDALNVLANAPIIEHDTNFIYWIHSIRYTEAMIHIEMGDYQKGTQKAAEAVKLAETMQNKKKLGHSLNTLAIALEWFGKIKEAREYYLKALETKKEIRDEVGYANTLCNLGALMSNLEDPKDSKAMYFEALTIYQKHKRIENMARTHELLGFVSNKMGQEDNAIAHYRKANDLAQLVDNELLKVNTLKNLVGILASKGHTNEAEKLLAELQHLIKKEGFIHLDNSIKLIEASILRKKPRASNKVRAQLLYRSVLSQPDIKYETAIASIIGLIELCIFEWQNYATEEEKKVIEAEIHFTLNLLDEEISRYNSLGLKAEFLYLKGIAISLLSDKTLGYLLLQRAQKLAKKENWILLENKATQAMQKLTQQKSLSLNDITSVSTSIAHYSNIIPHKLEDKMAQRFLRKLNEKYGSR